MEKINLFLMDMTEGETFSGVDRYLEMLLKGLARSTNINLYHIQIRHSSSQLLYTVKDKGYYQEMVIPSPQIINEIIQESYWNQKFNEVVFHLIKHLFENKMRILIHIHTLNLIDLALYIKKHTDCKIITHLHCIPWKGNYNRNKEKFNLLYKAYQDSEPLHTNSFISSNWEIRSYTASDWIICVTQCGKEFVQRVVSGKLPLIDVIPNGMEDYRAGNRIAKNNSAIEFIYVGFLSESKGIFYILDAMRKVQEKGYNVKLHIAGQGNMEQIKKIKTEYSDVDFNLLGCIPFDELKKYYQQSDIGIIASLQEQASYVAIEMAMFGLPIITTAVDGLDETFTNELNALKVNTLFSEKEGLIVDVEKMTVIMIELICNKKKRLQLGRNARKLFKNKLTLSVMTNSTLSLYNKVFG